MNLKYEGAIKMKFMDICSIEEAENTYIKDWYTKEYPEDEWGQKLKGNLSFYDLFEALDNYQDIYEFAGIDDSIIRERLFEKLSEIMGCEYDEVYNQWMLGSEMRHFRSINKGC